MALQRQTIKVSTEELGTASTYIAAQAEDFKTEYVTLYRDIDAMQNKWSGEDYEQFKGEMYDYKPELEKMYQLMKDYSRYLSTTKSDYETTQGEIAKNARAIISSK